MTTKLRGPYGPAPKLSIAKRFAELALARFQKKEPETPEYTVACERVIALMTEGLEVVTVITHQEAYELGRRMGMSHLEAREAADNEELDRHYSRTLRDD